MSDKKNRDKNFIAKLISRFPDLSDPKIRLKTVLYGGAAVLGVIFIMAISIPATSHPTFCGQVCHSMKREYVTWAKSSHSNITCTACHVEQGLGPLLHEKAIEGPLGLLDEFIGAERPINIESKLGFEHMSKDVCERCHNMVTRKVTPSRIFNEKMYGAGKDKYHNKHLEKDIPCTICHNRVVHKDVNEPEVLKEAGYASDSKEAKREYEDGMNMTEGCFRCHSPSEEKRNKELVEKYDAEDAPRECSTCHNKKLLPIGHKDNSWRSEHKVYAKKDLNYCFGCHGEKARFNYKDKKYCTRCHAESLVESWN